MSAQSEAYKKKVRDELQQAKSKLVELEARSKAQDQQAITDLVNGLKSNHRDLVNKQQQLESSAVEEMDQEAADIDAGIAKLRAGLEQLDSKLNAEPRKKVS